MTASLHKLTAGSGYEYLTRQVASGDRERAGQSLSDYYSAKGEQPGQWTGAGLAALGSVENGSQVTEEQMRALFGEGLHPDAERLVAEHIQTEIEAGRISPKEATKIGAEAVDAARLGQKFRTYTEQEPSKFLAEVAKAYERYNTDVEYRTMFGATPAERGETVPDGSFPELPEGPREPGSPVPAEVRSQIRTTVGTATFVEQYGRKPLDSRELASHIARETRPQKQAVSGYDLTFSPVKSVSALWAIAPREVAEKIEAAHSAAVAETLQWAEQEVFFTRRGTNGVRSTDTTGVLGAAFVHRDSRAGDPDLHTHVAVSAKVQDVTDGQWRAVDGQVLYKSMVSVSERYNSLLEEHLTRDLGVSFTEKRSARREAKQTIREVAGVPPELLEAWSSRRVQIERRMGELSADFTATHGRPPTPKEAIDLRQQANLETREAKQDPKSLAEQRTLWRQQAVATLGGDDAVDAITPSVVGGAGRAAELSDRDVADLSERVLVSVSGARARFQVAHIRAEAERRVRGLNVSPDTTRAAVDRVVQAVLDPARSVRLDQPLEVSDPAPLRRRDGASVYEKPGARLYTTEAVLAAENRIVEAAKQTGARTIDEAAITVAMLEFEANKGRGLNEAQAAMVRQAATDDHQVLLALAPAGSGKTTSMRVLAGAWRNSGGNVMGFGPSAVAAAELGGAIDTRGDTLAKLVWHLDHPDAPAPGWMNDIGQDTLLLVDEAGMASTADLDKTIGYATARGAKVFLIGDDQQLSSVQSGGVLRDIQAEVGAMSLSELVRFKEPGEGAATLQLRRGDTECLGWYLDNNRVCAVPATGMADAVYEAWIRDTGQGKKSLMLAHANTVVDELNGRARQDMITQGRVDSTASVVLRSGLEASAGDVVVTRLNERTLRTTGTDWVKNGDRWTVIATVQDGALRVKHQELGREVTLPADYVATDVDLGYASTIHGAQGQTVDSCYVMVTGDEARQLLYVGMSRGIHMNQVFVPSGTDGDPHQVIHESFLMPKTVVETLRGIIERDGSQVSARTERRVQSAPTTLLPRVVEQYEDSLGFSAATTVGPERMAQLTDGANTLFPNLSDYPAWDTLAGHLAVLELNGQDPLASLDEAIKSRELDTARDVAAVLDYRLGGEHSRGNGPLPWLMPLPPVLAGDETFGPSLTGRQDAIGHYARAVGDQIIATDPADRQEWAAELVDHPHLLRDVAVWRCAQRVPDEDRSPLGPPPAAARHLRYYRDLEQRLEVALGPIAAPAAHLWNTVLEHSPHLEHDPWALVLRERIAMADAAGAPVQGYLTRALSQGPLPDEHAASALWSRIEPDLAPVATLDDVRGVRRLRPAWTDHLLTQLPEGDGATVLRSAQWPQLVATVNDAARDSSSPPEQLLDQAVRMLDLQHREQSGQAPIPAHMLTTVLAWRVHDLVAEPPPEFEDIPEPHPDDVLDADVEQFLRQWRAEEEGASDTPAVVAADDVPPEAMSVTELPPLEEPQPEDVPEEEAYDPDLEAYSAALTARAQDSRDEAPAGTTRARVIELNTAAAQFYTDHYPGSAAQRHNEDRFGTDLTDTPFVVGHAPERATDGSWAPLANHLHDTAGATDEELVDAGLAKFNRRDRLQDVFRGRAMFGVQDTHGDIVGFIGRDLTPTDERSQLEEAKRHDPGVFVPPKYQNTSHTTAFSKGAHLFGLYETTQQDTPPEGFVRVEGTADAVAIHLLSQGRMAGVAPLGTALTDPQIELLARHSPTGTIWSGMDNDSDKANNAGQAAARDDMFKLADRGLVQRTLVLPPGADPADCLGDPVHGDYVRASLGVPDILPLTARAQADDLMNTRAEQIAESGSVSAHYLQQAADMIAALPPEHWSQTIQHVAQAWPHGQEWDFEGEWSHDAFYADQLTDHVIGRAIDWDPGDPRLARLSPGMVDRAADKAQEWSLSDNPDQRAQQMRDLAERLRKESDRTDDDAELTPAEQLAKAKEQLRQIAERDAEQQQPARRDRAYGHHPSPLSSGTERGRRRNDHTPDGPTHRGPRQQ